MKINEVIDRPLTKEQIAQIIEEGITWNGVKNAIAGGLIALSAFGITDAEAKAIADMTPEEVKQELMTSLDDDSARKLLQVIKGEYKDDQEIKQDVQKKQVKKVDTTPAVDTNTIERNLQTLAKQYMRSLGYDTNTFGHQTGKGFLSDLTKSGIKGNGYWNFQIEVENRYGGDERIPVVIGFGDYKVNKIKVDGKLYNITDGPDIRKNPF
jgi:superfamily I DNA and/or RNA helicase